MSLVSKEGLLERVRNGKESRMRLVASNLSKGIAYQIRATRAKRGWKQSDLAAATEISQNNLSRLESEDYGKQTITSLRRIAEAMDVALIVRFVPFSQYIDWLSGTPYLDKGLRPSALAVPSFDDEEECGELEATTKYWPVLKGGRKDSGEEYSSGKSLGDSRVGSFSSTPDDDFAQSNNQYTEIGAR